LILADMTTAERIGALENRFGAQLTTQTIAYSAVPIRGLPRSKNSAFRRGFSKNSRVADFEGDGK